MMKKKIHLSNSQQGELFENKGWWGDILLFTCFAGRLIIRAPILTQALQRLVYFARSPSCS